MVSGAYAVDVARQKVSDTYPTTKIAAAATLYKAAEIDQDFFLQICVDLLRAARVAIAVQVEALMAIMYAVEPLGFTASDYSARDAASLTTILAGADFPSHVQRFAIATLDQASRDFQIAIGQEHGATHWRWKTAGNSCEDCLIERNRVYPITEQMVDHPNCNCYPEIIFPRGTDDD